MSDSWIEAFKGQHVTILTLTGSEERNDTGTLVEIGGGWIQLVKDNGDVILVPSTAIRIIKLLSMTQTTPGIERESVHAAEAAGRIENLQPVA